MDYELIKNRIETIANRVKEIGGDVPEVIIGEPATLEQIMKTEKQLGVSLPESFKKVLKVGSLQMERLRFDLEGGWD